MKIHTTQNLTASANINTTNMTMPKHIRSMKYSNTTIPSTTTEYADSFCNTSFKAGKKPDADDLKKAVDAAKRKLEAIKEPVKATKRKFAERVAEKCSNILASDSFGKILSWTQTQEVLVQSGSALIVCSVLRPATLALFPGDKNKQDFLYAAGHSVSSGLWGFGVSSLFVKPPASGVNFVLDNMSKYIKDEVLAEMYPHLDINSTKTVDKLGNKIRKPVGEWLDKSARKFYADTKNVRKVFKPLHLSEVSEETLVEKLKDLNLESIKDSKGARASANVWKNNAGKEISFALEDMFICVKDEARKAPQYYPLEFVNPEILKKIFPNLDEKSMVDGAGRRIHPDMWKEINGKAFKLDKDMIFISSPRDSAKTIPLVAGYTRVDAFGKVKDVCYQDNAKEGIQDVGTEITTDMLEAAEVNKIVHKIGGWLPDIVVTYPRASATIAVLPFILKHGFGLEKSKKPTPQQEVKNIEPIVEDAAKNEPEALRKEVV